MKRHFFTALALTVATVAIAPVANAAEFEPTTLQQRRYEILDRGSKDGSKLQETRYEVLDNTSSKAIGEGRKEWSRGQNWGARRQNKD